MWCGEIESYLRGLCPEYAERALYITPDEIEVIIDTIDNEYVVTKFD